MTVFNFVKDQSQAKIVAINPIVAAINAIKRIEEYDEEESYLYDETLIFEGEKIDYSVREVEVSDEGETAVRMLIQLTPAIVKEKLKHLKIDARFQWEDQSYTNFTVFSYKEADELINEVITSFLPF